MWVLSRKLQSRRKCHPKHTSTRHGSRSSYSLRLFYTTYVGKSDHVSRLSQLCEIKSFCVFTGSLHFCKGVLVAQTLFCCDEVPALENTILDTASGQKKARACGQRWLQYALLWCGMFTGRKTKSNTGLYLNGKNFILQEVCSWHIHWLLLSSFICCLLCCCSSDCDIFDSYVQTDKKTKKKKQSVSLFADGC